MGWRNASKPDFPTLIALNVRVRQSAEYEYQPISDPVRPEISGATPVRKIKMIANKAPNSDPKAQ